MLSRFVPNWNYHFFPTQFVDFELENCIVCVVVILSVLSVVGIPSIVQLSAPHTIPTTARRNLPQLETGQPLAVLFAHCAHCLCCSVRQSQRMFLESGNTVW